MSAQPCRHILVLACALLVCASSARGAGSRIAWAEVELRGPLNELVLATDGAPDRLRFEGGLAEGEARTLAVPLPVRELNAGRAPRFTWDVSDDANDVARGRARFVRWLPAADEPLARIAPALRARPRPPVSASVPRVPAAALLVLAAGALVAVAARRRVWLALASAAVSGVLAARLVVAEPGAAPGHASVLEGATDRATWLAVESAFGRLDADAGVLERALQVALEPPDATLEVVWPLRGGAPVRLLAPRARIHLLAERTAAPWSSATNELGAFAAVWTRTDGAWSARGPWAAGSALPPALTSARANSPDGAATSAPGWLTAGLPQGVDVVVGEFAADARARERHYLRLVLAP